MNSENNSEKYSKNLNLLLKQQIMKQIDRADLEMQYEDDNEERDTYQECMRIDKRTSSSVVYSKKCYFEEADTSRGYHELKVSLANIQLDESNSSQQHKILSDQYDLLEQILELLLQHIDCIILEAKSSTRLSDVFNAFAVHENYITEPVSIALKKLCEKPNLEVLEEVKTKLYVSLNGYEGIKQLRNEHEQRKNDYRLALKNFKIILEVMHVNRKSLAKLKNQFDDVLMNYQHCRCLLDQELPFVIAERTKVLSECLKMLGNDFERWIENRQQFSNLIKNLDAAISSNEYVLVKKYSHDFDVETKS